MPFPLDFPQANVPYLKENVRYVGFPTKTTAFLTFWTDFVPFPTFSDENLRYLGCCCCPEKTDVTLVVVVVVVVVAAAGVVVVVAVVLIFLLTWTMSHFPFARANAQQPAAEVTELTPENIFPAQFSDADFDGGQ